VTPPAPRVVPFGDRALLVTTGDVASAHALARRVAGADPADAPATVDEVVVGFACVLVVLDDEADPDAGTDLDGATGWLARLAAGSPGGDPPTASPTTHVLPTSFGGPDLDEVAGVTGLTVDAVVDLLVGADLEVAFVGFAPGFPYLTGLPEALAALPRRATPRTSVPAGSVAVAGGFASVYPRATPGGWNLLGRTTTSLFDPHHPPYALVSPGDRVRFVAVPSPPVASPVDAPRALLGDDDRPALVVVEPGLLDLVQDAGRPGSAAWGVPRAGAADPHALGLVNLLLGNHPGAAGLEVTGSGPRLRVVGDAHVAVVGAAPGSVEVAVDGRPVPDAAVVPVGDGQEVSVGRVRHGLRAYLGVAGGLATPVLLGSRSSDLLSGLGPGRLRAGDRLARGTPGRVHGALAHRQATSAGVTLLRVLPGPHVPASGPGSDAVDRLTATSWQVGAHVDRVGVHLEPTAGPGPGGSAPVRSTPMVTGAVQLPPDGRPIVLLPDHATVGGYPVVACVIAADLALLGQLAPGDALVFVAVDRPAADVARRHRRQVRAAAVTGWFPTAAGT